MTIFVVEFIHIKIFVDYFLSNVLTSHTFGQTLSTTLPKLPKHPSVEAQQWLEFRLTCFVLFVSKELMYVSNKLLYCNRY
jgi:hypothetical protein